MTLINITWVKNTVTSLSRAVKRKTLTIDVATAMVFYFLEGFDGLLPLTTCLMNNANVRRKVLVY